MIEEQIASTHRLMEKSTHMSHALLLLAKQHKDILDHDKWYQMASIMDLEGVEKQMPDYKEL
tara:strand:+ start:173518 stop:173703 length:186 start_codon:yes stop_codon:yes gene_type:complete